MRNKRLCGLKVVRLLGGRVEVVRLDTGALVAAGTLTGNGPVRLRRAPSLRGRRLGR